MELPRHKHISVLIQAIYKNIPKEVNPSKKKSPLLGAFFTFLIPCIISVTSMVSLLSQNEGLGRKFP